MPTSYGSAFGATRLDGELITDTSGNVYAFSEKDFVIITGGTERARITSTGVTSGGFVPNNTANVRSFGATGNGTTDDTAAIQAALDSLNSTGGELFFPVGTYLVTSSIIYTGTKPITVRGMGMENLTKIKAQAAGNFTAVGTTGWFGVLIFMNAANINHFTFKDFYVDMTGRTDLIGLMTDNCGYTTFQNLKFREGAVGWGALRVAGCNMINLHSWNQTVYGFAQFLSDGAGGTGAGTITVGTNGQANSWTDCEYRMTGTTNSCTAGYAILSGQQDINFTNCHAERLGGVGTGIVYGFYIKGSVSTWPPDATWAGEVHMVQCNADGITDQASGTGAGFWFENYRHVRMDQCWDSAMDVSNAWYSPAIVVKNCQDITIRACEISANGLQFQSNVDIIQVLGNHFLNAGTTTTAVTFGAATVTNLVFEGNTKKVTGAAWADNMASLRTARKHNNNIEGPMRTQDITAANTSLQNGTPTFLSWTTPNDGQMHPFIIQGSLEVSSLETGGQINMTYTHNGATNIIQLVAAGQAAGVNAIFAGRVADPNTVVSLQQGTALTGGAATISAAIVGS